MAKIKKTISDQIISASNFLNPFIIDHLNNINFNPSLIGLHCPLNYDTCPKIVEIVNLYSPQNVFVAIPYSSYAYEESIRIITEFAGLKPVVVKDRISSQTLLCKVCRDIRISKYGIADFGSNNLNVIYEIGLMQSLGKKVAILKPDIIPGDLQGIEYLDHDLSTEGLKIAIGRWYADNVPEITDRNSLLGHLADLTAKKNGIPITKIATPNI